MKANVHRPLEGVDRIILTPESDDDRSALEWLRDNRKVFFGNDPKTMRVTHVEIPIGETEEQPTIETARTRMAALTESEGDE